MRSKPDLEVHLSPHVMVPGAPLLVHAKLTSKSETPITGVRFDLSGIERRYSHTVSTGKSSHKVFKTFQYFELAAMSPEAKLGVGTFEYSARFDIPPGLPPSYTDEHASIVYRLKVRVCIPWWPDRTVSYDLLLPPARWSSVPSGPTLVATNTHGPQHKELYMEATLDPHACHMGGSVEGALSVTHVEKVKQIKIAIVAQNMASFASSAPAIKVRSYAGSLLTGQPPEGTAIPFKVPFPPREPPSFRARLFQLVWTLELTAVMSWAKDVVMIIPLVVGTDPPLGGEHRPLQRLPPIGHERRAAVWAAVAGRQGMINDAASEVMTASVGAVEIRIELEQREEGLCSVATLSWPDAGIDLHVGERKWTDRLRGSAVELSYPPFDERFVVRAREPAQALAFLGSDLANALLHLSDATVADDGALLSAPGGGHRLDSLDRFVTVVRAVAAAVDRSLALIPAPAQALGVVDEWRAFAAAQCARLEIGSLSLRGLKWDTVSIDVVTEWDSDAKAVRTTVEHALEESTDVTSPAAASILASAKQSHRIELAEGGLLRCSAPALAARPQDLEARFAAIAQTARSLRPRGPQGPYR